MMEAASTSEASVIFYQTRRRNNPEDSYLHTRCRENLKSRKLTNKQKHIQKKTERFISCYYAYYTNRLYELLRRNAFELKDSRNTCHIGAHRLGNSFRKQVSISFGKGVADFSKLIMAKIQGRKRNFQLDKILTFCEMVRRLFIPEPRLPHPRHSLRQRGQTRPISCNPFMDETCCLMFSLSSAGFRKIVPAFLIPSAA
jgi:hypothetical protein